MNGWKEHHVEHLEKLFQDASVDTSEIIRSYFDIVKEKSSSSLNDIIPFLNQKAVRLLSPELVDIVKNNRIGAYSYLLVANNLLDSEDVKDDLLYGDVLANAISPSTIRRLKAELGLLTTDVLVQVAASVSSITTLQPIQLPQKPVENWADSGSQRNSLTCEDMKRLPIKLKNQCTESMVIEGMTVYKLKVKQVPAYVGSSSIIKRFSFGEPSDIILTGGTCKTILLMGATGSGKTMWINALVNYVLGVEWDDSFRFMLIKEHLRGASQANSQTQGVTAYDLHYREGFRIPFSLTVIDTPGFGDTGGMERDEDISSAIQEFFNHENGIQELDAVGFVVQSALVRLTISQKCIFSSIFSIFGKDVKENIRFLVTFADGQRPPALEAIKEAGLPCRMDSKGLPCHQKFNNGAIYIQPMDDENDDMSRIEWMSGMNNFNMFFAEMNEMPTKSLQMTNEVIEHRKQLEIYRDFMLGGINNQLIKMEELRTTKQLVALNKDKVNANQNFEMKVPVAKKVKKNMDGSSALNCTNCQVTCHYPCHPSSWTGFCPVFWQLEEIISPKKTVTSLLSNPSEDSVLSAVMDTVVKAAKNIVTNLMSPKCKICPGACSNGHHKNENFKWVLMVEDETRTFYGVRNNYQGATKKMMDAEAMERVLQAEVDQLKDETIKNMNVITDLQNKLKTIALHGNHLSTYEYIQIMMDTEERVRNPGCEERINNLKELLESAKGNSNDIDDDNKFTKQFTSSSTAC